MNKDEIEAFTLEMENKFKQKLGEKGESWKICPIVHLESALDEEIEEYQDSREADELIDIANMCWMLYSRKKKNKTNIAFCSLTDCQFNEGKIEDEHGKCKKGKVNIYPRASCEEYIKVEKNETKDRE